MLVKLLQRWLKRLSVFHAVVFCSILAVLGTQGVGLVLQAEMSSLPWRAWVRATPAVFWGLALGQTLRVKTDRERRPLVCWVLLAALVSIWVLPHRTVPDDVVRRFSLATALACVGFAWRPNVPQILRALATVTFGVYLIHPLVGKLLFICFDVFSWSASAHAGAAWLGACGIVLLLRRSRLDWHECRGTSTEKPPPAVRAEYVGASRPPAIQVL